MNSRDEGKQKRVEEAAGHEQTEPGKPTRSINERGELDSDLVHDVEEIAEQQGATQRGFTGDREEGAARSPDISPTHPDLSGEPEEDLPR